MKKKNEEQFTYEDALDVFIQQQKANNIMNELDGLNGAQALKILCAIISTLAHATETSVFDWYEAMVSLTQDVELDMNGMGLN